MDVEIGSNVYRNTNGMIAIEGVPQLEVAIKPSTGTLLVNFALFDGNGKVLAKVSDSTLMFNERRAYEVNRTAKTMVLKQIDSGKIILQMEARSAETVAITKGEFHTVKGHVIVISPTEWKIDKVKASGTKQDMQGGEVVLG
ncbi:MAG TPA: hypothetical protein VH681_03390 [Nitrospiraceae bacterium]|jgi:hypothetical protein